MSIKNKIFSRLNSLDIFVSAPPILSDLLSMLEKDDSSAKRLSEIILKDADMTARILRVANRPFHGSRQKVATIDKAVMILGQNAVKCLLISTSVYNQVTPNGKSGNEDFIRLWQHFLETAAAAQTVAQNVRYATPEEAFMAGFLHDIGLFFLQRCFPDESARVKKLIAEGRSILQAERDVYECDHQEVGLLVATNWKLPDRIAQLIRNHHFRVESEIETLEALSRIVVLADNLSPSNPESSEKMQMAGLKMRIIEACCDSIGMGMDDIKTVYSVLPKQILYHAESMNFDMGDAVQYLSGVNAELFDLYIDLANTFKERQELSKVILKEERIEATLESLHIALATLSHYINNSTMSISGQAEVMRLLYDSNDKEEVFARIPAMTDAVKTSIRKISVVLEELSNITSLEKINYFKNSKAIDIEKSLKERLDCKSLTVQS